MRRRIERDAGCRQHRRRLAAGAAQQRAQPGIQFAEVEGLDQVVVGAGVEALDAVLHGVARGEDQHRQARLFARSLRSTSSPSLRGRPRSSTTAA
jgi:GrpB-like predicted nucleotidyltransferase (UPF0157 family)